jgi:SAM-dependent methyltransferase
MSPDDVNEWGGFDLHGLLRFRYETLLHYRGGASASKILVGQQQQQQQGEVHTTTLSECMNISQFSTVEEAIERYEELQRQTTADKNTCNNESILLVGCGNSKVGEQILMSSFVGPVLQIDISSKIIQLMTQRYQKYFREASVKRMELIVDDARELTALSYESVGGGVLDKGLVDVLHCSTGNYDDNDASEENPIRKLVESVHRVLQPSRPFIFFSRSEPEYILKRTLGTVDLNSDKRIRQKWKEVQVLKLVELEILLYKFVKK